MCGPIMSSLNLVKLEQEKGRIQKRLGSLKKIIRKLYEDFADDLLDSESYHEMLSEYTQEQRKLTTRLSMITGVEDGGIFVLYHKDAFLFMLK